MTDVHTPETRSRNMAAIKSGNTKPEVFIRSLLHRAGFRFRIHVKNLPGKPDIVLPKYRSVILIHGCFWHGHDCHLFKLPKTRTEFWESKISGNRERDIKTVNCLSGKGWKVLTIWECAVKGKHRLNPENLIKKTAEWITNGNKISEIKGLS